MNAFEKNVLQQISLLDDELRALNERRKLIEAQIAGLRMFLSASEVHNSVPAVAATSSESVDLPDASRVTLKDRVTDAALRILEDGLPRNTSRLIEMFAARGVEVDSSNKLATVSSILSRDGRFKADRRLGWTLTKRESPGANGAFDLQPTP